MKLFMEILLDKDCYCKTDGSERLYSYSEIEKVFYEYEKSVPAETHSYSEAVPQAGAVAEDTKDGSLFIYENKELINIKFLSKERFEKLIDTLRNLVIAYRAIT